jgi:hypothetical protein
MIEDRGNETATRETRLESGRRVEVAQVEKEVRRMRTREGKRRKTVAKN